MKVTLPEKVTGQRDALFVLEVEFPVATVERRVEVGVSGPVEPLDLSGSSRGGTYRIPVGLERLHVPMRVLEDGEGEALITVTCLEGPEATLTDNQRLTLEAASSSSGSGGRKRLLFGGLALAAVALLAFFLSKRGASDVVPDVRGQPEKEALSELREAEFVVRPTYDRQARAEQDGRVIRQVPAAGTPASTDRIVEIVIGLALSQASLVPPVVGDVVDSAERTLEGLGYQVIVTERDNDEPRMTGRVLAQIPDGGEELASGGQVEIVVARAPAFVLLSDLVGMTREEAERALDQLGLLGDVVVEDTAEVRLDGLVMVQMPLPGSQLDPGARVALTVGRASVRDVPEEDWSDPASPAGTDPIAARTDSTGPDPLPSLPAVPDVPDVPDVVDANGEVDPRASQPEPLVGAPDPVIPEALERDAEGQTTIPDFTGWTREEAVGLLKEAGLQPIVTLTPVSNKSEQARVIRQRPAPGVKRGGGMVFLTIGEGAPYEEVPETFPRRPDVTDPVAAVDPGIDAPGPMIEDEVDVPVRAELATEMPDVVGLQQAAAELLLVELGLIVRVTPQATDFPPAGTVLAQDPTPGEPLERGAQVRLDVAASLQAGLPADLPTDLPEDLPADVGLPVDPVDPPAAPPGPEAMPEGVVRIPAPPARGRAPLPPVRLPARDAPKNATVPAVKNMTVQDAVIHILRAGLIPIIEMDRKGQITTGRVGGQVPAARSPVLLGDLVRLRVGAPPRTSERMVDLPTVIGADLDVARRVFAGTRTGLEIYEIRVPNHPYAGTGRVAGQYPVSAMPRAQAGKVTLFIVSR